MRAGTKPSAERTFRRRFFDALVEGLCRRCSEVDKDGSAAYELACAIPVDRPFHRICRKGRARQGGAKDTNCAQNDRKASAPPGTARDFALRHGFPIPQLLLFREHFEQFSFSGLLVETKKWISLHTMSLFITGRRCY